MTEYFHYLWMAVKGAVFLVSFLVPFGCFLTALASAIDNDRIAFPLTLVAISLLTAPLVPFTLRWLFG